MKRLSFVFATLLSVMALTLTACSGGGSGPDGIDARPTNEIRIPSSEPLTLDPHKVTDVGSHAFTGKLYAGLVRFEPALFDRDGKLVAMGSDITQDMIERFRRGELFAVGSDMARTLVADLATEVPEAELNADGTVSYTFTIREDAKFANGRAITARDVAYSLERTADPRTRSSTAELYLGDILGVMEMKRGEIINRVAPQHDQVFIDLPGIEVVDERTIRITIDGPKSYFLMKLTYPAAAVVDKVQAESPGQWTDRPNSTGPFIIVKREVGEIVMAPNPNYHGTKPALDRYVHYLSGGPTKPRYDRGDIHFAGVSAADPDILEEVRNSNSELSKQYFETSEMSTSYIGLNSTQPPFDDPLVRQALAMAIDKESIAREVLRSLAIPAYGILPPGMPGYREGLEGLRYDPDRARELLAQSRYANNMPRIQITTGGGGGSPGFVLQSIVEFWRTNLGIEVEIEQTDSATLLRDLDKGTFQMFSLGWVADYPDPEDFLDLKFHSERSAANNETRYSNAEVDALLEEARTEQDQAVRIKLYRQAEDLIVRDVPWIPLFHSKNSILVKPNVCGYFPTPMGISVLQYVTFCE